MLEATSFVLGSSPYAFWLGVLVKVSLVLGIGLLSNTLCARMSAAGKHFVLLLTLTALLIVPALSVLLPAWELTWLPTVAEAEDSASDRALTLVALEDSPHVGPQTANDLGDRNASATRHFQQTFLRQELGLITPALGLLQRITLRDWFIGLWLAGILFFALQLAHGLVTIHGLVRVANFDASAKLQGQLDAAASELGLGSRPRVAYSSRVGLPILWGWRRPLLILPEQARQWGQERLELVFLHELAHLKRLDGVTLLLIRAVVALYWFHPLVWWTERISRSLSERACDDVVLSRGHKPSVYASHLLSIASGGRGSSSILTPAMARRSQMEKRLRALLHPSNYHGSISSRRALTLGCLFLLMLVPISALTLVAQPPATPASSPSPALEVPQGAALPTLVPASTAGPSELIGPPSPPPRPEPSPSPQPQRSRRSERGNPEWSEEPTPETGKEWFQHAFGLHQSDRFPEAIEAFQQAASMQYRVSTAYYNIACGYSMMNDRDTALAWLERAVEAGFDSAEHLWEDSDLDPLRADPRFQSWLAKASLRLDYEPPAEDRLAGALEVYRALATESSRESGAWSKIGLALLRLRQFEPATDALMRTVELRGDSADTEMYNLACVHSLLGDVQGGLEWLNRAVDSGLSHLEKLRYDPDLDNLRSSGVFSDVLQKAETLSLEQFRSWKKEGEVSTEEMWRPAVDSYSDYVRRDPSSGRAWSNLGYAHHYLGEYLNARRAFGQALRLGYHRGATLYNLACGHALLGEIDAAFARLAEAESAGFSLAGYIGKDQDLANLRTDPRYNAYRERYHKEHLEKEEKKHRPKQRP